MSATHYHSTSKGPVEIAAMQYNHAVSAHAKLQREAGDPAVISALADHIAHIESTFEEQADG